jgi:hypothetical protein
LGLKACNPNEAEMPVKDKIQHEQPLHSILLQSITVLPFVMSRRSANSGEGIPDYTAILEITKSQYATQCVAVLYLLSAKRKT